MPNDELSQAPYSIAHKARNPLKRSPKLPESHGESVSPQFLLGHENHFDKVVVTPEDLMKRNEDLGGHKPITQT